MGGHAAASIEVVAGLLVRNDSVLICQRAANAAFPLKWEFPGGKVEPNEDAIAALRRELREELAIEAAECRQVFTHLHRYPDMPPVALRFYRVSSYEGEVANLIFQQIVWTPVERLGDYDFLEGDLPFIRQLMTRDSGILAI